MPEVGEIHQCEVLAYLNRCLEYVCKGKYNARWRLIWADKGTPIDSNQVIFQHILYCPGCGKDLRQDIGVNYPGKPHWNEILIKAGCKGTELV